MKNLIDKIMKVNSEDAAVDLLFATLIASVFAKSQGIYL